VRESTFAGRLYKHSLRDKLGGREMLRPTTGPQRAFSEPSFSSALICATSRRIPTRVSTNQGPWSRFGPTLRAGAPEILRLPRWFCSRSHQDRGRLTKLISNFRFVPLIGQLLQTVFFSSFWLSSLELSDIKVYEPQIRAFPGTASHLCAEVVLQTDHIPTDLWKSTRYSRTVSGCL